MHDPFAVLIVSTLPLHRLVDSYVHHTLPLIPISLPVIGTLHADGIWTACLEGKGNTASKRQGRWMAHKRYATGEDSSLLPPCFDYMLSFLLP